MSAEIMAAFINVGGNIFCVAMGAVLAKKAGPAAENMIINVAAKAAEAYASATCKVVVTPGPDKSPSEDCPLPTEVEDSTSASKQDQQGPQS